MTTLLYLAPIALVIGLIASGRVPLIGAALAGLAATLPAAFVALEPGQAFSGFVLQESLKGLWLAWHAVSVILAGLVLHHAAQREEHAGSATADTADRHAQAYRLCFLAGPFVESAVGFGIGYAVTIIGLRRLGTPMHGAVALGYLSQMLVPWGALAIGSVIGASLGNLPLIELGSNSALLMPPFLLALLGWLWWWSHRLGFGFSLKAALRDLVFTLLLAGLLIGANLAGAVDAAGVFATGALLALAYLPALLRAPMTLLRPALPYLLLVAVLLFTRLMPGISGWLQATAVIAPFPELPDFPLLYHPAMLLLLVAALHAIGSGRMMAAGAILGASWRSGRIAVASTVVFLVMARLFATSGMATALAESWQAVAGDAALLATPAFAALAGGMTGSNTASNSLMLPMQAALAGSVGASIAWTSALQNVMGSLFTSFFPGKVALACAFAGWAGGERQAYRTMLPLGLILLPIGILIAAFF